MQVWFPNSFRCGTDGSHDWGQEESEQGGELWLFLKLSRVNHDCCPNTAWFPHAGGVRLVALRAVEGGRGDHAALHQRGAPRTPPSLSLSLSLFLSLYDVKHLGVLGGLLPAPIGVAFAKEKGGRCPCASF